MIVKLKDICIQITDGSHNPPKGIQNSQYLMLSSKNIEDDYITLTEPRYLSKEDFYNENKRTNISANDLLMTIVGTVGRVAIVPDDLTNICVQRSVAVIKPKNNVINNRFLMYQLQHMKSYLERESHGVAQKGIYLKQVGNITIKLPSLEEQRKIDQTLDKVNDLISKRKQQLEKLDLLVKSKFVEMFGDLKNNSFNFKIVSFEECIEYICDIGSNGANSVIVEHLDMKDTEDYALMVRFLNFTKNDFKQDVKYISKESYEFFKKTKIFGGELIICKIGSAGQNYIMPYLNRPVSLGLNQIMVRVNKIVSMTYLYQYINSDYGKYLINGCINGAVTKSITKTELKKIPIILPPIELQNQFADFVKHTEKTKTIINQSLEKLETLKKALMQEYFG